MKLPPSTKAVLKELAWFANPVGKQAYPSVGTIAARTGYTPRCVQIQLRRLEMLGLVRGNPRSGSTTTYCFIEETIRSFEKVDALKKKGLSWLLSSVVNLFQDQILWAHSDLAPYADCLRSGRGPASWLQLSP